MRVNVVMGSLLNEGWICYAEKTLGSFVLPYVSSVKSPQQAIGAAIKHHLCQALGLRCSLETLVILSYIVGYIVDPSIGTRLEEIYHVTVMPCYDKKLEAARDDFVFGDNLTEVDSVLTTGEILDLLKVIKIRLNPVLLLIFASFLQAENVNMVSGFIMMCVVVERSRL